MSAGLYDNGASTVLILPLVSMHDEYKARARRYGMACETWTTDSNIATTPQVLLVAVENCSWPDLQSHIMTLIRLGRLARIVVDEAHLLVKHESFRLCMRMLAFLGTQAVSIVLMTATCPIGLEQDLFRKIGRKTYQVVRRSTDRPDISHQMVAIRADKDVFEQTVATYILTATSSLKDGERALLFCNSRDECDRMASLLNWMPYHSSITITERAEAMKAWKDGVTIGLSCTSMLNCCLDYSHVRKVFHLGAPRDAIDYYQAIGRAGRDEGVGESIVYFNPDLLDKLSQFIDDPFGRQIIYNMLTDDSLCRRIFCAFFLDGIAVPCTMLPGAELCDICLAQSTCAAPDMRLHPIPDHLAPTLPSRRLEPPRQNLLEEASAIVPNPINQPAPLASVATHLAAANSCLELAKMTSTQDDQLGYIIRTASDNLSKSCISCWSNGFEYHSHCVDDCSLQPLCLHDDRWRAWRLSIRFPVGCCFYCGCPQKVCSFQPIVFASLMVSRCFIRQVRANGVVFMNTLVTKTANGSLFLSPSLSSSSRPQF